MTSTMTRPAHDWYDGVIPVNVALGANVYLDTTYGFTSFASERCPGLIMGDASGAYDRTTFDVGPRGRIIVGPYTCLNGTYLFCNDAITIGAHCLVAWGAILTDTWLGQETSLAARRLALRAAAADPTRRLPPPAPPAPIVLEDSVWVGFDSVILPGVTLGRGCVIGCKTIVDRDVPPYAVVVGASARIVRYLNPDDDDQTRDRALREQVRV